MIERGLLCGDLQQPSEYMYEAASPLEDRGVTLSRMEWRGDVSAARFRELTMEMESRGPGDYEASAIRERLDGVELLVVHKAPVSGPLIESAQDLAVIGCARGGYENIDVDVAEEHGVSVLHGPGRNRDAVADYAVALLLASVRRIPHFASTTADGQWALEFDPETLPRDLASQTVGVVGFGNVGRGVARRLRAFGADLLVHDPYVEDATIEDAGAEPASLGDVLSSADAVTLHVRLTDETRHLIGADEFDRMAEDAILVNTARGGLIDEEALIEAIRGEAIGGAALDVFEEEPLPEDHPLLAIDDVILSPHTAGSTRDAVTNGVKIVTDGVLTMLDGGDPAHRIVY